MKSTGIVRKIDSLGRIVVPKELRKILNVDTGNSLEVFTDSDCIILKKYEPGCSFCGEITPNMTTFNGKHICSGCKKQLL